MVHTHTHTHAHTLGVVALSVAASEQYIENYNGPIYLDELNCDGSESSLLDCPTTVEHGYAECSIDSIVAVHCEGGYFYMYVHEYTYVHFNLTNLSVVLSFFYHGIHYSI